MEGWGESPSFTGCGADHEPRFRLISRDPFPTPRSAQFSKKDNDTRPVPPSVGLSLCVPLLRTHLKSWGQFWALHNKRGIKKGNCSKRCLRAGVQVNYQELGSLAQPLLVFCLPPRKRKRVDVHLRFLQEKILNFRTIPMWCRHESKARHKLGAEFLWTSLRAGVMGVFLPFSSFLALPVALLMRSFCWAAEELQCLLPTFCCCVSLAAQEFLRVNSGFDLSVVMGNMSNLLIQLLSCCSPRARANPGKCFQLHQLSVQCVLAPDRSFTWADASMPILCNQYWTNLGFSRAPQSL